VVETWTLQQLVDECAAKIRALPAPKNGQVRAVPDERTIRYYATLGLLDRPAAMRGRTALYNTRHLAQVVAIKRLQVMGRSLAEIQTLWPTLDDTTLTRMSGVSVAGTAAHPSPASTREQFWKREPIEKNLESVEHFEPTTRPSPTKPSWTPSGSPRVSPDYAVRSKIEDRGSTLEPGALDAAPALSISIEIAPNISITLPMPSGGLSQADVRALRAAAAPLVTELARRQLLI